MGISKTVESVTRVVGEVGGDGRREMMEQIGIEVRKCFLTGEISLDEFDKCLTELLEKNTEANFLIKPLACLEMKSPIAALREAIETEKRVVEISKTR